MNSRKHRWGFGGERDLTQLEINEPRPFGVDYVPHGRRVRPKKGEAVFVGLKDEIPPGKAKSVALETFRVAVFNVNGEFFAIKDACPHAEYPLSKGVLHGVVVACASHNWQFDVRTGQCLRGNPDIQTRTFTVEIRGDEIWVVP